MKSFGSIMGLVMLLVSEAHAETIMGTVKDANRAAVRGAFVRARSTARSKITINVSSDSQGRYRIENVSPGGSGLPLTRFDPKTETFRRYENARAYDVNPDLEGNIWFTWYQESRIGRGDAKTGEIKMWDLPTKGNPRRIVFDSKGIAWVGVFNAGKIARFDPKTETFKEYDLPGPRATPYAMGIDARDHIWYSSRDQDVVGRLDPNTGQVTEYPMPFPENYMKEFFLDDQGRMWYGSPPNNKVGYFILPDED